MVKKNEKEPKLNLKKQRLHLEKINIIFSIRIHVKYTQLYNEVKKKNCAISRCSLKY